MNKEAVAVKKRERDFWHFSPEGRVAYYAARCEFALGSAEIARRLCDPSFYLSYREAAEWASWQAFEHSARVRAQRLALAEFAA